MYYKKKNAEEFTIPGGTNGVLYPSSPKGDQTIAIVETDGVYPKNGVSMNDYCTETFILIKGKLEILVNDKMYILEDEGDLLRVLPKNKYSIKGKGKVIVSISPNWKSEQNHIIK